MKKLSIIVASLLMLISLKINAQNQRVLLLESFTNTSCGWCGVYNPGMDAIIANNPDKVVAIKYHVNWPGANDPMYLHNPAENGARVSYYGVTGVPHVVVDGNRFSGNSGDITQGIIDQLSTIESPMELRLSWELDETQSVVTVHVMGRTSAAIQGNLKLFIGVIEKEIHFNSAPGTNGEKDFYDVMKKLLPGSQGLTIGELAADDYFAYNFSWEVANFYDLSQIDAIAWVQNPTSKEVIQACGSSENFEPFFANEACVSDVSNVKGVNCSGEVAPKVLLTNYGSHALTSVELEALINGETMNTIQWSGNLATFASEIVDLGDLSFPVEEENMLEVKIKSVNGGGDESPNNDIATKTIKGAPLNVGKVLKLTIRTDDNPEETTWQVTNMVTGEVVLTGGPYEEANHKYEETLEITGDGCYDFTIFDAGGDGLQNSGIYGLKAGGSTLFSGKEFEYSESNEFSYEVSEGTEEMLGQTTQIFPNPTSSIVNIMNEGEQVVTLFNMAGQRVYEGLSKGFLQIDMKDYGAGVYAIKVGNEIQRVVVQ